LASPTSTTRSGNIESPSSTRKILILWAIIFGATLLAILLGLRPITEFLFDNSPYNYVDRGRKLLNDGEPEEALKFLMGAMHYLPPEDEPTAFRLIADCWEAVGQPGRRDLWSARARFQEAWLADESTTTQGLEERWGEIGREALSAVKEAGAAVSKLDDEWSSRLTAKMFFEKAKAGAPIEEWVAARSAEDNLGLLLAGGARLLLGAPGLNLSEGIYLQSAAFEHGKGAIALVEGEPLIDTMAPGYNVVAISPDGKRSLPVQNFNTYGNRDADQAMAQYLENLPQGWIVLIVVSDEAAKLADPATVERGLNAVGIELPAFRLRKRHLGYREPFVGIGIREGKGACVVGDRWGRPATLVALPRGLSEPAASAEPEVSS
jgi:hypothetical protein